jgi:hypothetical protein
MHFTISDINNIQDEKEELVNAGWWIHKILWNKSD